MLDASFHVSSFLMMLPGMTLRRLCQALQVDDHDLLSKDQKKALREAAKQPSASASSISSGPALQPSARPAVSTDLTASQLRPAATTLTSSSKPKTTTWRPTTAAATNRQKNL
jgi:hypothetical protein